MTAVDEKATPSNQRNSDGSQHTYNEQSLEEDQKTLQVKDEDIRTEETHYPAVLECAPFPALGSLEEITQTLSRVRSNQTQKNFNTNEKSDIYLTEDINTIKKDVFKQEEYHTDGIRNPGWLTVLSCFLVNFFVFGSCFSWGIYQKL